MSRAYYACALVAVLLFWISFAFSFISEMYSHSVITLPLVVLVGFVLPSGAIRSAIKAYQGVLAGRIWLALFALLAGAFLARIIEIQISSGRYYSESEAQFHSILLVVMAVSHVALIIRSPV